MVKRIYIWHSSNSNQMAQILIYASITIIYSFANWGTYILQTDKDCQKNKYIYIRISFVFRFQDISSKTLPFAAVLPLLQIYGMPHQTPD